MPLHRSKSDNFDQFRQRKKEKVRGHPTRSSLFFLIASQYCTFHRSHPRELQALRRGRGFSKNFLVWGCFAGVSVGKVEMLTALLEKNLVVASYDSTGCSGIGFEFADSYLLE